LIHPLKGRGRWVCVAGGSNNGSEITVWDIDKVQCREVYRTAPTPSSHVKDNASAHNTKAQRNTKFIADTSWKYYEPWRVDDDRPEGMLARFAANSSPSGVVSNSGSENTNSDGGGDRNGIRALAVGVDVPENSQDGSKCGFLVSAGSDRKVRFWDVTHPDASMVISGLDIIADGSAVRPRYDTTHPTPSLTMTTEWMPTTGASSAAGGKAAGGSGKKPVAGSSGATRPPRNTVISLQQQQLLKSHLDPILDVAILEAPYGMTVSVDRGGMIYVFQ
jgi:phosphoinositide-3-kinase regulatory subunit 4